MKAFKTAPVLLGLLSTPATATQPIKSQAEVSVGGVTFRATRFTDGRSTPYRIYFWDDHLTGSSYRFSRSGHLEYFKAGSEVYYDRTEKDDGSLKFTAKEAKESGGRHNENKTPMYQGAFTCDDCVDDLAAVCGAGLPAFCEKMDEAHLGYYGSYSVGILCDNYEGLCHALQDGCDAICIAELEQTSTCDNGFVGVQASNGACCDVDCGPTCGGVGCSSFGKEFGLDKHDCCSTEIVDFGKPCSEAGEAPCFIDNSTDTGDDDESGDVMTCGNGFVGVQASNGACCDARCGPTCGGVGCSSFGEEFGLGMHDCCSTEIVDFGKPCSEAGEAPCFVDDSSNDDLRDVIMDSEDSDSVEVGSIDATCKRASLTAADLEGLDVYDLDMYIEPGCMETTEHLPNGCNFMGLGQGCRGCYETCDGAMYYIKMNKKEIDEKGEDAIVNFCPDSGLSSLDECRE